MVAFHVFVDGSTEASPEATEQLAVKIAGHYGLPVADLRTRIASGRFRVKGNCDRATADTYVRDLTALGARCSIEEASPANASKTPLPFPAVPPPGPAIARTVSALPPRTAAPAGPAIARTTSGGAGSKDYQSGLSAAFSGASAQPVGSLGALDEGAAFTLSSVDGADHAVDAASSGSFGPPPSLPASMGEAIQPAKPAAKAAKPASDAPLDMFAPPDAADDNFTVDLAPEEADRAAKKKASPPPPDPQVTAAPVARYSRPSLQPPNTEQSATTTVTGSGLADPKIRFALGVVIAIVLGFIPAHLVARAREHSAFAEIDAKVIEIQGQADAPDTYAALDGFRATQLDHKHEDRRNAALLAMLVWAAAGAGVAFVWFKKILPADQA